MEIVNLSATSEDLLRVEVAGKNGMLLNRRQIEVTEELREMKTYRVYKKCPKCGSNMSWKNGRQMLCNPPRFKNECDNPECSHSMTSTRHYPYIMHKEVSDDKTNNSGG